MNFFRTPFFLPWLYPNLTWRIKTEAKELYLTFDDGPVPGPTEFVLETLKKFQATATFFCIGDNIQKHPGLFKKIIESGHAIGNHTFNHISGWKTGRQAYIDNVKLCDVEIEKQATGYLLPLTPIPRGAASGQAGYRKLFRPPYGRITRDQIKSLNDYEILMWDVLTHDYAQGLSNTRCLNGSIGAVRPGSLIVFHDSLKAEGNMQYVLPRLLDHFSNLGYTFKSIV